MKSICVAFCFLVLSVGFAHARSGYEMLQACESAEHVMRKVGDNVLLLNTPDVNKCWGFMEAVEQYSTLADQTGRTFLNSCPPLTGINTTQVLRIFTTYARKHPEELSVIAAAVAYNAMADAFPCK